MFHIENSATLAGVAKKAKTLHKDRCIELARGIHRGRRMLVSHAQEVADKEGLNAAHVSMINALGLMGEMRMGELASSVVVGSATITRRAKQLEERNLVVRRRSSESEREVLISLTDEGEAMFERSFRYLHGRHRALFDERFTEKEQLQLQRLLAKL